MPYTSTPNSGESLGQTRVPINDNFSIINTVFAQNHVQFDAANQGKHKLIQIPTAQAASPGTASGEVAIYTKVAPVSPNTNVLFMQPQNVAAAGADIQISPQFFPVISATGTTFLPGGLKMAWGTSANSNAPIQTISFGTTFGTAPFSVVFSVVDSGSAQSSYGAAIDAGTITTTNFKVLNGAGHTIAISFLAIGKE